MNEDTERVVAELRGIISDLQNNVMTLSKEVSKLSHEKVTVTNAAVKAITSSQTTIDALGAKINATIEDAKYHLNEYASGKASLEDCLEEIEALRPLRISQ